MELFIIFNCHMKFANLYGLENQVTLMRISYYWVYLANHFVPFLKIQIKFLNIYKIGTKNKIPLLLHNGIL
jgi:hypothetical protein